MKEKIKANILTLLETYGSLRKQSITEIIQNNHKGTRVREINLSLTELIAEYKIELSNDTLSPTVKYINDRRVECVTGMLYN